MTDSSIRFVPELFFQRAIVAPEVYPYLKEHEFDKLSENGTFNLEQLDLTAFEMKHVLPANMPKAVKRVYAGWAESFNAKVKNTAAASKYTRTFF